uniref:Putative single-stranded DNA-binding protein n=1 Tax=viral metagenome TaxID=1070528 RepID=A0A6M3IX97_9ZZZZ
MNKVILLGNLVADPETRYTSAGMEVTIFRLAVNQGKDKDTLFVKVSAFQKIAELIKTYCRKGNKVLIEGKLDIKNNKQKDETWKSYTQVIVNQIFFLGSKNKEAEAETEASYELPF